MKSTGFRRHVMRVAVMMAGTALLLTTAAASTRPIAPINGNWRTDDGKAVITIGPCSEGSATQCGRISRFLVAEPAGGARDSNNPNRNLRNRSLMGVQVLSGLTWRNDSWVGNGYSPEEGRNFNATVRLLGNGRLSLRGCVAVFCRTVEWTRAR
jgi:uncharacterized protein (DUF2147 family)